MVLAAGNWGCPKIRKRALYQFMVPKAGGGLPKTVEHETRRLVLVAGDGDHPETRKRVLHRFVVTAASGGLPETVEHKTWCLVLAAGNGRCPEIRKLELRHLPFAAGGGGLLEMSKRALHRLGVLIRSGSALRADGGCGSGRLISECHALFERNATNSVRLGAT